MPQNDVPGVFGRGGAGLNDKVGFVGVDGAVESGTVDIDSLDTTVGGRQQIVVLLFPQAAATPAGGLETAAVDIETIAGQIREFFPTSE